MNSRFLFYRVVIILFVLLFLTNCQKEAPEGGGGTIVFNPNITYGTLTDIDGNTYKTVTIGTQVWMAENLRTTKYTDGTAIPNVTDDTEWSNLTTGAYCNLRNDQSNVATYGRLYNWYAVNTGKLCPTGWHVSSSSEWYPLENYLIANGYNYDGTTTNNRIAKALASSSGWQSSNLAGTIGNNDYPEKQNATGFTALPGDMRSDGGGFNSPPTSRFCGLWWDSFYQPEALAGYYYLFSDKTNLWTWFINKKSGLSVRCVRD